jgi:PIN domain nuclease of toxin-antitoxin system
VNVLVDTHYLLWSLIEPERLDPHARDVMENNDDAKYASAVTFWEISLKCALGKLELGGIAPEQILPAAVESGFHVLPLDADVAAGSHRLPSVLDHRDPFDRLLIWQCIQARFAMLSSDARFDEYARFGLILAR